MSSHSTEVVVMKMHNYDLYICYCPCGVISRPKHTRGEAIDMVLGHVLAERRRLPVEDWVPHDEIDWDAIYAEKYASALEEDV